DLLDKRIPGEVIRFVLLSTHYRKPMDWTDDKARAAEDALWDWRVLTKGVEPASEPDPRVIEALADDLNTAGAISVLYTLKDDPARLLASARFLGLLLPGLGDWMTGDLAVIDSQSVPVKDVLAALTGKLTDLRAAAMAAKDFSAVDALKAALTEAGVEVRMSKTGVELIAGPRIDAGKLGMLL
ncbi:MAG: DALR domain-containing protein, partial [Paracoccus sp. (in: a-proteobacteria)]